MIRCKQIVLVVLSMLLLSVLVACGDDGSDPTPTTEDLALNLTFDESASHVVDQVSKKQYTVEYVFNEALYKSSMYAPRSQGVSNQALLFDGYSTSIEVDPLTNLSENFTISFYMAPRAYETRTDGKTTAIFSNLDTTGGFEFAVGNYGKWTFTINTTKGTYKILQADSIIDLYAWNHIVISYSNANDGAVAIYKNGDLVINYALKGAKPIKSNANLLIGMSQNPVEINDTFTGNHYSGLLDEFKIYNQTLSANTIKNTTIKASLNVLEDLWLDSAILADDQYFPQYHLRVSQNWQNEAYGFFYYEGYYHVFCQQNPMGPYYKSGQRWGHFISTDLVHWTENIPALLPEDNNIDENDIFSGCAILDGSGKPVIFYTGINYDNKYVNQISSASPISLSDSLLTSWQKSGTVVIAQGSNSTANDFRDPFVYEEDGQYYMLIGGTNSSNTSNGAIYCYKAENASLTNWTYLGITYSGDTSQYGFLGNCYELPNLFKVYNKSKTTYQYVLMFSPINGTGNGVYYMLGDFNKTTGKFTPNSSTIYQLDIGPKDQVLCPSGFYDAHTDRNILITMTRNGMTSEERYDSGWATVETLCKEMYLGDDGTLRIAPISEYDSLIDQTLVSIQNTSISTTNSQIPATLGDMLKIELEIDPGSDTKVGVYVKYDMSGIERTLITYDLTTQKFYVDNSKSSANMRNNGSGGGVVDVQEDIIKFTIYVDRSMVEAYLGDYNEITVFGFNTSQSAQSVQVYSSGNTAQVVDLKIYSYSSAYGTTVPAYWK